MTRRLGAWLRSVCGTRTWAMTEVEWRLSEQLTREREQALSLRERLADTLTDRRKLQAAVEVLELEVEMLTGVCKRDLTRVQAEAVSGPMPTPAGPTA